MTEIIVKGFRKNDLSFNEDLAIRNYETYCEAYESRKGLFERFHHTNREVAVWHSHLPPDIEWNSREHRLFLFGANLIDYQTKADTAFRVARRLWDEYRLLFTADVARFGNEMAHHPHEMFPNLLLSDSWKVVKILADRLKKSGYTSPNQAAERWLDSFKMLWEDFDGEPINIFRKYPTVAEYVLARKEMKKIKNGGQLLFPGLGTKLFSLLAFHLEEFGVIPHIEGALPVDVHIQSQHLSCNIVSGSGRKRGKEMEVFIRPRAVEVCYRRNIEPFSLAAPMWFNGSENCFVCNKGRNTGLQKMIARNCPVYENCHGRIADVKLYRTTGEWNLDGYNEQQKFNDPAFFALTPLEKPVNKGPRSRRDKKFPIPVVIIQK
ncbi:MAG: hypothetical protein Q7S34_04000 [bacterium]|nr:hypothetical protein [bacterium]